jgi:RNA polymerase sigma-70 factor (ECF subfamily)
MSYQEIANKIEEPLSNVKIKLLRAKTIGRIRDKR